MEPRSGFGRFVDVVEVLALAGAAITVILLGVNAADDGGSATGTPANAEGAAIFEDTCARCHGAEGQGVTAPALAGTVVDRYPDPADQIAVVTQGSGAMPAFGGALSPEQIEAVVSFTREDL
jgi:mono/diheme cytochrome c family protein